MCGIIGVFNYKTSAPVDRALMKRATDIIQHRGPDGEGFYFDDESGVGFGHRRLSIIDLSTGDQPMCNEDGTVWIIFNGEIYNYQEVRRRLLEKGHKFKSNSDTEVIIHAYEEYGVDCPKHFNGIFAFAIWDKNKKRMFVARDHFGVKPLYYYNDGKRFIFGSEIKSILAKKNSSTYANETALNMCFTFRHTPAPYTLFDGIYKLSASQCMLIDSSGKEKIEDYWDHRIELDLSKKESEWVDELTVLYENAVDRQMMSDVPIGISLSGGVDSGAILALMTKYGGKGIHAFTVNFEGGTKADDESDRARKTAQMFGARFHNYEISLADYSGYMDKYIWHLEEPVGNESAVAYYFVAKMANPIVKVLLNGQGADEPFAGYDRYLGIYFANKIRFLPKKVILGLSHLMPDLNRKNQLFRFYNYINKNSFYERVASAASILSTAQRSWLFNSEFDNQVTQEELENEVRKIIGSNMAGYELERFLFYDMFTSLSENLLLCEDKMAMAASIEARVPFLDLELIKCALSIPGNFKVKNRQLKYIHKKVCEKYVPKDVVYQRKIGFNNPVDKWLMSSLGNELVELIESPGSVTSRFLNKERVLKLLKRHQNAEEDNQRFLYLLLSIEKWRSTFNISV